MVCLRPPPLVAYLGSESRSSRGRNGTPSATDGAEAQVGPCNRISSSSCSHRRYRRRTSRLGSAFFHQHILLRRYDMLEHRLVHSIVSLRVHSGLWPIAGLIRPSVLPSQQNCHRIFMCTLFPHKPFWNPFSGATRMHALAHSVSVSRVSLSHGARTISTHSQS